MNRLTAPWVGSGDPRIKEQMMGRRKSRDDQLTFVPDGDPQPAALQAQPHVKGQLFEPDMARFFPVDWKFVRIGHRQWSYLVEGAEAVLGAVRASQGAILDRVRDGERYPEVAMEFGLPEAWEEYSGKLKLLHQAYPQYLEWFARRVELEYHGLVDKWSTWFDAAAEEGFSPEFWELDCRVCAYEDFMSVVHRECLDEEWPF